MADATNLSVIIPKAENASEHLKIEFVWNGYMIIITRLGAHRYSMAIFQPKNDGSYNDTPIHTEDQITNLMTIRTVLEGLFEAKII